MRPGREFELVEDLRQFRPDPARTKSILLQTAERLMMEDGYTALSARRIANAARCAPSLIFHYFKTIDELTMQLFRSTAERELRRIQELPESEVLLQSLFDASADVALSSEFQALAVHNAAIKRELAQHVVQKRRLQEAALVRLLESASLDENRYPASGVAFLLSAVSRAFRTEASGGLTYGHREARLILAHLLEPFTPERVEALFDEQTSESGV